LNDPGRDNVQRSSNTPVVISTTTPKKIMNKNFATHLIILNNAIACKTSTQTPLIHKKNPLTVNAIATVNSFPCITNAKNEIIETNIGAVVQRT